MKLKEANIKKINLKLYNKEDEIGRGSYGIVYKTTKKKNTNANDNNKNIFAAKVSLLDILKRKLNDQIAQNFVSELVNHSHLFHPCIVSFIGYSYKNFQSEPFKPTIMMEYIENGTLEDAININRKSNLNDTQKLIIIYGIASSMKYLHSLNIIHRDLKPLNILLNENFLPKLTDFGISIDESILIREQPKNIIGTSAFIAPEIWNNMEYSKASDVYAFSIVVYELMTNQFLFENYNSSQILYKIAFQKFRPTIDSSVPIIYQNLIKSCWSENKNDRPTFEQIVSELQTNENFITKNVDRDMYHMYIRIIDQYIQNN